MTGSLRTALKQLRLSGLLESLEVRLHEAAGNNLNHAEFLELLLQDELAVRSDRQVRRRVKAAQFRELKTIDDFDWSFNPSIKKKQVFDLATCRFVRETRDVLFLGPPGDWLDEQGLKRRKIAKTLAGGHSPDRDAQFQRIALLKAEYRDAGNPIFSIDTKAKEHLGQLFREGRIWTQQALEAFDHDFPSWATGVIIPHGIYDLARNRGHINIGLSHDTSRFACDSFRWYWNRIGRQCYPQATSILWLCDGGGSNSATHHLFKRDLQELVNDLGIEIRVAHNPSYCSKYNPIERRLFPHITRACQGMPFETLETVVGLMRKATTRTGLRTTVNVIRRADEIGLKVADDFKETMMTVFDQKIPKWNYRVIPQ